MIEPAGIDTVWPRVEAWLRAAAPAIAGKLRPPADDAVLAGVEAQLGRALPEELKLLLRIHDGGREACGGLDLLDAESIVTAYRRVGEYASEVDVPHHLHGVMKANAAAGWIPFAGSVGGDYLCIDLDPGPAGTVGQVFGWNHDDHVDPPMAPSLTAWLARIATCVEAGEIVYDAGREEFLPFAGAIGFAMAFEAEPPVRFDAARREVRLPGRRSVALRSVESVGPLPTGCRIELAQAGAVVQVWDVDALRVDEECATDFTAFVEEPAPWFSIGPEATLRASGLAPGDIVWVALASDDTMA